MTKNLIVYGRPPSANTHIKYSKTHKAFMGAMLTSTAKQHGAVKSIIYKINDKSPGHCYLLRTGEISDNKEPKMHLGLGSGRIGSCLSSYNLAGVRIEFNLLYQPDSIIFRQCQDITQTALLGDDEKRAQTELMKEQLEKTKLDLEKRTMEIKDFEKKIFQAMDEVGQTKEEGKAIQHMLTQKVTMMSLLKIDRQKYENAKRKIKNQEYLSFYTSEAPVFMFGNRPCLWLNKAEVLKKIDKTMLCWSLEILDVAKPIDSLNAHCDYGKAEETQKQYNTLLKDNCSKEELELLIPVKLTSQDNYQNATPIL